MAELFGKATGVARREKGGSMHLFDAGRRFMGGPRDRRRAHPARPPASEFAIRYKGGDQVCICYFGRGGGQHRRLPRNAEHGVRLQAARDLRVARTTATAWERRSRRVAAVTDVVEARPASYDMAAELVNGMDVLAVYEATRRAAERARDGGPPDPARGPGPTVSWATPCPIRCTVCTAPRKKSRSSAKRDPISQLAGKLKEDSVLDEAGLEALDAEARSEAEQAVRFADESPDPDPGELTTHVLAD